MAWYGMSSLEDKSGLNQVLTVDVLVCLDLSVYLSNTSYKPWL